MAPQAKPICWNNPARISVRDWGHFMKDPKRIQSVKPQALGSLVGSLQNTIVTLERRGKRGPGDTKHNLTPMIPAHLLDSAVGEVPRRLFAD